MRDPIDRQAAIYALMAWEEDSFWDEDCLEHRGEPLWVAPSDVIKQLPAAQPEIIRCSDCKYSDENWRRVSVRWLPCMDIRVPSNWFCGSAERRKE